MSFSPARSNILSNAALISVSSVDAASTSKSPPEHYDMRSNSQDGLQTVRKLPRSRSDAEFIDFVHDIIDRAGADSQYATSLDKKGGPPQMLDLTQRNAKRLPLEVIELIKDHTISLALSRNPGIAIPPEISMCSRLSYLNLRWNKFDAFPDAVLGLTKLQTLDVSSNNITVIPDAISCMQGLKHLAFANNRITRVPLAILDMPNLVKTKLDRNPLEYPPLHELGVTTADPSHKDYNVHVCTLVKQYLRKTAGDRHRDFDAYMSESNIETPRPPRRPTVGRFPVRPSFTANDNDSVSSLGSVTGDGAFIDRVPPPIPQRSNARESLVLPPTRRPGLAPINTQGLSSRSRSETVASGSNLRAKRLGYVPSRKMTGPTSAILPPNDDNSLKPDYHFRNASSSSYRSGGAGSFADASSNPVSPSELPNRPWVARSRLSSLPEDRRVSQVVSPTVRSARLIVYSFDQLNRPIDDAVRMIKSTSTPGKQTTIERLHYNATHNLRELDRQLHLSAPSLAVGSSDHNEHIRAVLKRSRSFLQTYSQVVSELRLNARKMIMCGDPMYIRALMMQLFAALMELRNACALQEKSLRPSQTQNARISQARSDRTVTPTLTRPVPKRVRATPMARTSSRNSDAATPYSTSFSSRPPSRSNTMSSNNTANIPPTPTTAESLNSSTVTLAPHQQSPNDSEDDRQFDKIYVNLRQVCDLADQTLSNCRMELFVRKEEAARSLQGSAARAWTLALNKCDNLLHSLDLLKKRLKTVRVNDPANRTSKDFWLVCDGFVRSWYDVASEMKSLGHQGIDIGDIKVALRPLQKAVKDVGHILNHSTVYKGSLKPQATALSRQMPPTPLSAALGPAAQATMPSATIQQSPSEPGYNFKERERSDTVLSRYGSNRR